jgi:NLI interacting factor-like phosphatase
MADSSEAEGIKILLPSNDHILYEWKVRDGSTVQKGDVVAMSILKGTAAEPAVPPSVVQHRRPRMRGRKRMLEEEIDVETVTDCSPDSVAVSRIGGSILPIIATIGGIVRIASVQSASSSTKIVGSIEPCQHPAVLEGLCAVCGMSVKPKELSGNAAYIPPPKEAPRIMSQVTVSGGLTMSVSVTEAQSLSVQTSKRLAEKKKLHLVLDLDHTLVHATADPRARKYLDRDDVRSLVLPTNEAGAPQSWAFHCVKLRPHVKEFLENPNYEISVYTAGTRLYAEQITMVLSRFMVGAKNDHQDIIKLQHQVKKGEHDLKQLQKKNAEPIPEGTDDHGEYGEASAKKRVRFGEPPPTLKTDGITVEELQAFKKALKEAEEMEAKALELRQRLFGSRIVSRTDVGDLGPDVKSVKRIFPCGGTMAVIVDDREDVWAKAELSHEPPDNLLLVRPYHWKPFLGFADVNNAAGDDLSQTIGDDPKKEIESPADETDVQLQWTRDILDRLHDRYYNSTGMVKTCPQHLRIMRREVLMGSSLILSGLVPLHKQTREANKPRPAYIRYVEQLGAKLVETVVPILTHVVAARDGTDKIMQARLIPGCFVVKASWLMESLWSLTRREESSHLLGLPPRPSINPAVSGAKMNGASGGILLQGEDSDDEDDEDLIAELENGMNDGE